MSYTKTHYLSVFVPSVLLGFIAALQLTGCGQSPAGLPDASAGASGESAHGGANSLSGSGNTEAGATSEAAGEAGEAAAGASHVQPEGGSTATGGASEVAAGAPSGGTGGTDAVAGNSEAGGSSNAGSGGQGGTLVEAVIPPTCTFHTDSTLDTTSTAGAGGTAGSGGTAGMGGSGGTGGSGGSAGAALTVTLQVSPFVGSYLADATGRTLYTYGNDLPGDCNTPPVSNCITDCLISWPIFPAGARVLAAGLDDGAFGAIHRDDGTWQTTYYGWPIYYYKTDLLLGQVAGQGKSKTWHIVEKKLPGVFIMKPGSVKYLSDSAGHTLYVSAADTVGTVVTDPVSNCSGSCLATFEPFHETNFSVVSSLAIADFGSFVRPGRDTIQVAYKGMPLYRAATDLKSGDMTGTSVSGFTAALP
jgi:predicted lipoprotein with Yx(FWY)xxD motif